MQVNPSGQPGTLTLKFKLKQTYTYAYYYSWFRVAVNGNAVSDIYGDTYFHPTTQDSDPFVELTYDLTREARFYSPLKAPQLMQTITPPPIPGATALT